MPDGDARALDYTSAWQRMSHPVRRAVEHIAVNFSAPVTLDDLAKLTGRTPFQLIRAFRRELGITPHALLIRVRVERATLLLSQGESIASAAADVGFVDQTHFGRHFKRFHSLTPGRYLTAVRAGLNQEQRTGTR